MRRYVEDPAERLPPPGEVAVEIDVVGVLAGPSGDAVRVEVGDDPEIELAWWCGAGESVRD